MLQQVCYNNDTSKGFKRVFLAKKNMYFFSICLWGRMLENIGVGKRIKVGEKGDGKCYFP
jgi:hypothetical protein